jgi:hypothetical protein
MRESPCFFRNQAESLARPNSWLSFKSRSAQISNRHIKLTGEKTGIFLKKFNIDLLGKLEKFDEAPQNIKNSQYFSFNREEPRLSSSKIKERSNSANIIYESPPFVRKLVFSGESVKKRRRFSRSSSQSKNKRSLVKAIKSFLDPPKLDDFGGQTQNSKEGLVNLTNSVRKTTSGMARSSLKRTFSLDFS